MTRFSDLDGIRNSSSSTKDLETSTAVTPGAVLGDEHSSEVTSCVGGLSTEFSIGATDDDAVLQAPIAKHESRQVARRKLCVWLVLLVSAVATAVSTFVYIRRNEEVAYQADFQSNAHKVLEVIGKSLEQTLKSLDALTVSIVSHTHATNQSWPFITVPDFTLRAAKTVSLSDVVFLAILPLVTNETRRKWEEYSIDHDQWTNTSVQLQAEYDLYHGTLELAHGGSVNVIRGDFGDIAYNVTRDYLPQWQAYPNVNVDGAASYNWDWLSMAAVDAPNTAVYQHRMVISEAYLLPDPTDPVSVAETEIWTEWISDFLQPGEPYDEPASDLWFPIFDQLGQIRAPSLVSDDSEEEYDPSIHNVVGVLVSTLQWRKLLVDILPTGRDGVVVVFENPCNPTFTYQINGPSVVYLGRGDLHDTTYDDDRITSRLVDLSSFAVGTDSLYSGPPVDTEFCPFTIHVYGSDDMHKDYTNNEPVTFAILVVMIFVFTTLVFCFYDYTVEKRQQKVLTTAEKSSAIVSSLFPEQVREQLADAVQEQQKRTKASSPGNDTNKSRMDKFLLERNLIDDNKSLSANMSSPPIATLYPETTVMFADIAGFTEWSSKRDPVEVFTLLETLYGAFDAIAKRRRVFKVETIGDCYVAVVGLPMAEPKHAVVMTKFAKDCLDKMLEVTRELSATLGHDTELLALRVGLHSGPTMAGVLRGDKSRFQLFGDTVNTTARMESNGTPNRIHISQSTADLLTAAGKEFWTTKREELIEAKGKGTMQTYWVSPTSGKWSLATTSGVR